MSTLSAQVEELRKRAKVLRQGRWTDGADDAKLMEDAAETVCELRDMAQQAQRENEKLRELASILWFCQQFGTNCDDCKLNDSDGRIPQGTPYACDERLAERMRELGVEVVDG